MGGALLTAVFGLLIAAATGAEDDWSKALTIGMLVLAVICLLGALWAFGGWGAIMGLFRDSPAPVLPRIPSPDNPSLAHSKGSLSLRRHQSSGT
jgi:hypothetical protein